MELIIDSSRCSPFRWLKMKADKRNLLLCIRIKIKKWNTSYLLRWSWGKDIPDSKLKRGDLATAAKYHPSSNMEDGYSLEAFNAVGDSIAVALLSESDIIPLNEDEILSVRTIEGIPSWILKEQFNFIHILFLVHNIWYF